MLVRISKYGCTYWNIVGKSLERINLWSNVASSTSLTTKKKTGKFQNNWAVKKIYIHIYIAYNVFNINLFKMKSFVETCHFKFSIYSFHIFLYGTLYGKFSIFIIHSRFFYHVYLSIDRFYFFFFKLLTLDVKKI